VFLRNLEQDGFGDVVARFKPAIKPVFLRKFIEKRAERVKNATPQHFSLLGQNERTHLYLTN